MTSKKDSAIDGQNSVTLKLEERKVNDKNLWGDDLLKRKDIAKWLTNLISSEQQPLTISLHGEWGTGKTFLLKRWQMTLVKNGYQAIYFNAWEDDFSNDPLLSILGQLAEHLDQGLFKEVLKNVKKSALPLIASNASSLITQHTGLTTKFKRFLPSKSDLLKDYVLQHNTKTQLKQNLEDLAAKVRCDKGHPLVFIIDELDRCRPTFAIELLERVKHIFNISNIVFVFGLNRDELRKSLESVYGNIKSDVYLRRFFDFEFRLPEADSQGFTLDLMDRFQIDKAFHDLMLATGNPVHKYDLDNYRRIFPKLWDALGLSLRDIDYCIRLLALVARSIREHVFTHPYLLAILIGLKFKRVELYSALIEGNFRTNEVMDYIYDEIGERALDEALSRDLFRMEGFLYCADKMNIYSEKSGEKALSELTRVLNGQTEEPFKIISQRVQNAGSWALEIMITAIHDGRIIGITRGVFSNLAPLVDAYQMESGRPANAHSSLQPLNVPHPTPL